MEIKEWLYVLDYSVSNIYEIPLTETDIDTEVEDILKRNGLNIDECYFMFTSNRITEITTIYEK